jgi:hypothetical protein
MLKINLEDKLEQLKSQFIQHQENLNTVLALLEKADRRRLEEPHNLSHWNRVLDNLEKCLDEAKGRVNGCQVAIEHAEREIRAKHEEQYGKAAPCKAVPPKDALEELLAPPSEAALEAARRILSMSLEDVSKLTLEEVSKLHGEIANENIALLEQDADGILSRLDEAEQAQVHVDTSTPTPVPAGATARQVLLKSALEKICAHQINTISREEASVVITTYEVLSRRPTLTPKDERLKRILRAAVKILIGRYHTDSSTHAKKR